MYETPRNVKNNKLYRKGYDNILQFFRKDVLKILINILIKYSI